MEVTLGYALSLHYNYDELLYYACCISEFRILRSSFRELRSIGVYLASTGGIFFLEKFKKILCDFRFSAAYL